MKFDPEWSEIGVILEKFVFQDHKITVDRVCVVHPLKVVIKELVFCYSSAISFFIYLCQTRQEI